MPNLRPFLPAVPGPGKGRAQRTSGRRAGPRYTPGVQVALGLLRAWWPVPKAFGWALVTRHDDVREVLSRPDIFHVPFAEEMARLNDGESPGTAFILGIDDPERHAAQLKQVMRAFPLHDILPKVVPIARASAQAAVRKGNGSLDAIADLVTAVPLEICSAYYGVPIPQPPREFVHAALDVSGHLFGLPPIQPDPKIDAAAKVVRAAVDAAIQRDILCPCGTHEVLSHLVDLYMHGKLSYKEVRAFLMGMIIGFVPTNTIAGGHILDVLLDHREFLAEAQAAARQGNDDLLARCLFEALRFDPINFGPFRVCQADYTLAAETAHATRIRKGTKVLASTMSAMFDREAVQHPSEFLPGRPAAGFLHFGFGLHWCVGAFIAQAQLVETFKALLVKDGLRRAAGAKGQLEKRRMFPAHLVVEYQP